jgi:hypothetical protein
LATTAKLANTYRTSMTAAEMFPNMKSRFSGLWTCRIGFELEIEKEIAMSLKIHYLAVVVAAAAAFVMSSIWYTAFGKARMDLLDKDPRATDMRKVPGWKKATELVREIVIAYVVARFVVLLGVREWKAAVQLGVWLWFGFVFMILVGAVVWDNVPLKLTAIHAGDWLVKLPLMAVVLAVWRR